MFKCVWNKVKEIYYMWLRSTVFNRENLRVGAGSVVTKDVEPYSVVVGNPAYIIKYRRVVENKGLVQGVNR